MRIKLLRLPASETSVNDGSDITSYPFVPLGMPMLKATLESGGHHVDQDDLSVKAYWQNYDKIRIDLRAFCDSERVSRYIDTGDDAHLEEESRKIFSLTPGGTYDLYGISIDEGSNPSVAGIAAGISRIIKEKTGAPVLGGGRTASEVVGKLISRKAVDYWIEPGNFTSQELFLNFCDRLSGRDFSPEKMPHLSYLDGDTVRSNGSDMGMARQEEFDFIRPDFSGLPLDLYRRNEPVEIQGEVCKDEMLVLPYFFVRGCPNRCAFCSNSTTDGFSTKDPDEVAEDIRQMAERYRTKYFYFLNTSINPTKAYGNEVCDAINREGLSIGFTDCATFRNMDEALLDKLRDAGAARLIYGIETGSPRLLRFIGKDVTVSHAEDMLKKTFERGIWGEIELIAGLPYERDSDIEETEAFIRRNGGHIMEINVFKFWLDGRFLKEPERYGLRLTDGRGEKICIQDNKRGFDEITGLRWEEKQRQADHSYERIFAARSKHMRQDFPCTSKERLIFLKHIHNQIRARQK